MCRLAGAGLALFSLLLLDMALLRPTAYFRFCPGPQSSAPLPDFSRGNFSVGVCPFQLRTFIPTGGRLRQDGFLSVTLLSHRTDFRIPPRNPPKEGEEQVARVPTVPVIWLHGFPEAGGVEAWWLPLRHFCGDQKDGAPLSNVGRAELVHVVPDQRGYGASAGQFHSFSVRELADDLATVLDRLRFTPENGFEPAVVVGHDFGVPVAVEFCRRHPARCGRLGLINGPASPRSLMKNILRDVRQAKASFYTMFFQLPWLPEWVVSRNNAQVLRNMLPHRDREELAAFVKTWATSGTSEMLDWYRDNGLRELLSPSKWSEVLGDVLSPENREPVLRHLERSMVIWGTHDSILLGGVRNDALSGLVDPCRVWVDAGHWPHYHAPDTVNRYLEMLLDLTPWNCA
jgi:epoxide hydrolase 4